MERSATRDPHRGSTQGTHTEGTHTEDPHRGPAQGTHTGDPHRGEGPTEDPPPEGRVTQGTQQNTHRQYIHMYRVNPRTGERSRNRIGRESYWGNTYSLTVYNTKSTRAWAGPSFSKIKEICRRGGKSYIGRYN